MSSGAEQMKITAAGARKTAGEHKQDAEAAALGGKAGTEKNGTGKAGSARHAREAGFTLLEVLIALAILTVSMLILVSAQGSAAKMSAQADRILVGSMLARQKLAEVVLTIEKDGFSEQDEVIEDGDFDEAFPGAYPEFKWVATVKKVEVENISQVLDTASAAGADPTGEGEDAAGKAMDNSMMQTMMETASQSLAEAHPTSHHPGRMARR